MVVRFIHIVVCSFGWCIFTAGMYVIVYLCHSWFTEVSVDGIMLLQNVYYYNILSWTFCLCLLGHMCPGEILPGHRIYASSILLNVVNFFPNGCANLPSKQQWMSFLCSTSFPTLVPSDFSSKPIGGLERLLNCLNFHFPDYQWDWITLHIFIFFVPSSVTFPPICFIHFPMVCLINLWKLLTYTG